MLSTSMLKTPAFDLHYNIQNIDKIAIHMYAVLLFSVLCFCIPLVWLYTYHKIHKNDCEMRKMKHIVGYFVSLFFCVSHPFFHISHPGRHSREKSKDFVVYFFAALIKHEIRMKYEKCIASLKNQNHHQSHSTARFWFAFPQDHKTRTNPISLWIRQSVEEVQHDCNQT